MTNLEKTQGVRDYVATGFQVIRSVDVRNFRCYQHLNIPECARLNVITGDNGSGKTSIMEAIFLALSTSSEVALRLRQYRGIDGVFSGPIRRVEESLWGDYFHNYDMKNPISITVDGDGEASRSLEISRGVSSLTLPLDAESLKSNSAILSAPVSFKWSNASRQIFSVTPKIVAGSIELPDTGEDMPDFFHIASHNIIGSAENANRFSELSKNNRQHRLVKKITDEFKWITDLSIEVTAGSPAIFATVKHNDKKIPLPSVSGGINRMMSIVLAIASRPRSIVFVDEIENGAYFGHQEAMWRIIISLLRENDSQMFVITHSAECLNALGKAAGKRFDDISLWQAEQIDGVHDITRFSGAKFRNALKFSQEIR